MNTSINTCEREPSPELTDDELALVCGGGKNQGSGGSKEPYLEFKMQNTMISGLSLAS